MTPPRASSSPSTPGSDERGTTNATAALALTAIRKRFGEAIALDEASFILRQGTVHALLGENGAGKTTLMRVAFGLLAPDGGHLEVNGAQRTFGSPRDAIRAGIGMVHQHFMLVPNMTVAENIALGGTGRYDARQIARHVRDVGARYGLIVDPKAEVGTLSVSAQQRVEILKALVREAQILILDEPTAVLAPEEAHTLLSTMRDFVVQGGSVVLITHKLRDALEFADDVTVLRRGKTVYTNRSASSSETELASAMLGISTTDLQSRGASHQSSSAGKVSTGAPVFSLRDVIVTDTRGVTKLEHVSLTVHAGEIVGIAAIEGNGQHELLRILANRQVAKAGIVEVPKAVGFVPEDRHRDALVLDFTLYENVALAGAGSRRGTVAWNDERVATEQIMHEYDVRGPSASIAARTLSGGNQQKLVVGREISTASKALVIENPTRGLDVQAAVDVHTRLHKAKTQGVAIVVYSSDLDEVLALADRIVVLYGKKLSEVPPDREAVGNAMIGRSGER